MTNLDRTSQAELQRPLIKLNDEQLLAQMADLNEISHELVELFIKNEGYTKIVKAELNAIVTSITKAAEKKILTAYSVDELAVFPLNIPESSIEAMKAHGVKTIFDTTRFSITAYETIHGIGSIKAKAIVDASRLYAAELRKQAHVSLNGNDADTVKLIRNLYLALAHKANSAEMPALGERLSTAKDLTDEYENLKPLTGFFAKFFPNTKKKQAARILANSYINKNAEASLSLGVKWHNWFNDTCYYHYTQVTAEQIYADFQSRSSDYYSFLSTVIPNTNVTYSADASNDETAFSGGAISEALWKSITAVELKLDGFKATLRPYQEFGVKYALHQKRVLLGDDMGLGKTVQALAMLVHLTSTSETHLTHLVVAPLSVQLNWAKEIKKHSSLSIKVLMRKNENFDASKYDVIISTYERLTDVISAKVTGAVIVDEAHFVKNAETQRTQRVQQALANREYAMFMTGTAMENKLEELTNLICFVNPAAKIEIDRLLAQNSTPEDYRKAIAPVYLRRNKEDVLTELPELTVKDEWVNMSDLERESYRNALSDGGNWHDMRKIGFLNPGFAKMLRLKEILEQSKQTGEKVLIFSYYLEVLDAVAQAFPEIPQTRIDGSTDAALRQDMIDAFNTSQGTAIFISQINTGGVGVNLQSASRIVICEPQIKPGMETQAIARAHRMGQLNPVVAHRLATDDAVDERIVEIRNMKQVTFNEYAKDSDFGDKSVSLEVTSQMRSKIMADEKRRHGIA